jgi:diguanylate cyclase (GGDEF)-like protein/PAS domain S-box-containing protein
MSKKRILVVEDESITAMSIEKSLIDMGYNVTSIVFSGEEAIKKIGEDNPDLVLMDISLRGEMDGIEAAGHIRSNFNIPVIYLTAHSEEKILKLAKVTEPFGYIVKPFDDRELGIAVEMALYKHKMEDALRESRNKYRTLFRNATDAIYLIDPDTQKIVDCNPTAAKTTGYTVRQLRTMTVSELHAADEEGIVSTVFNKLTKLGKISGISGINQIRRDGKPVPIEINAATIQLGDKNYWLGIFRDITDRKKTEDAMRHERNKLTSILYAMEEGVYIVNQELDVEYMNTAFMKEFGITKGSKCHEYFHGMDVCPVCKNKKNITDKTARWEWTSTRSRKSYEIFETPLKNPDGTISKLSIFRDITDRKKMEKQMKEAALTDDLTGLFNRRGFFTLALQQCKLANRNREHLSLLYLDLDNFKSINDELGHEAGDNALIDTAILLKKTLRESDIIARIGGDEFAVLLSHSMKPGFEETIVHHLRDNFKIHNETGGHKYELIFSIGTLHFKPEQPCSIDRLLSQADALMYRDKKNKFYKTGVPSPIEKGTERRIFERLRTENNFRVNIDTSGNVRIKNLSLGGICLKTTQRLNADSTHKIMIVSGNEEAVLNGKVIWTSLMGTSHFEAGLKFLEINERLKSSIEKLMSEMRK